ncbi:MAG: hypothetical protein Q7S87_13855 [Agitococcus sp.]|nr:hypothetical protein [Agitococcus sp.]
MNDSDNSFEDLLLNRPQLPNAEDQLFTIGEDWQNNACINWYHNNWELYAEGYKEAGDLLVRQIGETRTGQDTLVYPIIFLYRQYLELMLKSLIQDARKLQDIDTPIPLNHKILDLWKLCHQLLVKISPDDAVKELEHINRLIGEFSKIDPTSMAFRYPQDKEGNPSLPGITHINLRVVGEVIGKISVILNGSSMQISEYLSIKAELESEYRHDFDI